MQGRVAWFDHMKGFGFIKPDGGGKDVFVHAAAARSAGIDLHERDRVEFEISTSEDRKGRQSAVNLRLIEAATTHTGGQD